MQTWFIIAYEDINHDHISFDDETDSKEAASSDGTLLAYMAEWSGNTSGTFYNIVATKHTADKRMTWNEKSAFASSASQVGYTTC
jgi:hypothetical protein